MPKKVVKEETIVEKKISNKRKDAKLENTNNKKDVNKNSEEKTPKKVTSKKTISSETVNKKNIVSKEKVTTKKLSTKKKETSSKTKQSKVENISTSKNMLAEYYDLPYTYNQTIVKILAQTPTTLFVYWDISDEDRNSLMNIHGNNFFNESYPILIVHNTTKNYSFEVPINDFANSWYIRTQEPNCDYVIELGRKFNDFREDYIFINSSNDIISPNDHVLFERTNLGNVLFKNVKSNVLSYKNFGNLKLINDMDKLYGNIYDVYSMLYDDETLSELSNPSSGEFVLNR